MGNFSLFALNVLLLLASARLDGRGGSSRDAESVIESSETCVRTTDAYVGFGVQ